jgi:uncharacterized membrane protein
MGLNWADHTVEIEAPIETCFDAIVDYETFPGWQSAVASIEVRDRHENGLGRRVSLFIEAMAQKVDYTLAYDYDRPTRIGWSFVEGHGVDDIDGEYTFEDLGGGRTRATYRLGIDPSLPIPGMIARRVHRLTLKRSVEELKAEAERRHAAAAADAGPPRPAPEPVAAPPEHAPEPVATPPAPEPVPPPGAPAEPPALPPAPPPITPSPEPVHRASDGDSSTAPTAEALGSATKLGKDLAAGAIGLARGAATTAVGLGREVAEVAIGRLERLLERERSKSDERERD